MKTQRLQTETLVIGIDPGLSGAIAIVDSKTCELVSLKDMPIVQPDRPHKQKNKAKSHRQVDIPAFAKHIESYKSTTRLCCIEKVHAMVYKNKRGETRGQGAASSFNFGFATGVLHGVLAAKEIPTILYDPAVWKMALGLSSDKSKSLTLARKLFPKHVDQFQRKMDNDRAEAALLAWIGAKALS